MFERLVYGFHPYGLPGTGTPTSIERITRSDLVEFHARYFAPNNCILAVVGDVAPAEAFAAVERAFGGWAPRGPCWSRSTLGPPAPTRRVVIVDVPGRGADGDPGRAISASGASPAISRPLDLAVRILGGDGANRLQQVLRTQRGLTYGASADLECVPAGG